MAKTYTIEEARKIFNTAYREGFINGAGMADRRPEVEVDDDWVSHELSSLSNQNNRQAWARKLWPDLYRRKKTVRKTNAEYKKIEARNRKRAEA